MSDVTFLSPSRLATYADCARKFDYDYVQEIDSRDETRLYLNQGLAYHETIEAVCDATDPDDDPEAINERALAAFADRWADHLDPDEYASEAHQTYQRTENRAAIDAFFDPDGGDGIEHARRSIETELWLECVHEGLGLHGIADNVLETDDGLHVVDYKRTLGNVISPYTAEVLEDHLAGEDHDPARVKNAVQTAAYIEGVKQSELYEDGMTVRFSFYGLVNGRSFEGAADGYEVSVRGYPRETTQIYEDRYDTIWALVEQAHEGITSGAYEPAPFELVHEEACPDCAYREMCPDRLAEEVRR